MWLAQSSRFSIVICVNSELSEHMFQNVSFLYIIILCQFWLVELSRFQYYFNCDHMFVLFDLIESYICEVQLHYFTEFLSFCLLLIELYSSCHEVKNSSVNLLHSVFKDSLQIWLLFLLLFSAICSDVLKFLLTTQLNFCIYCKIIHIFQ